MAFMAEQITAKITLEPAPQIRRCAGQLIDLEPIEQALAGAMRCPALPGDGAAGGGGVGGVAVSGVVAPGPPVRSICCWIPSSGMLLKMRRQPGGGLS